ncbi:DUF6232 family protein [Actinoplanes sp. NPDC048796]|uniref:DUF6232 family protein n=1 Tax=unclassified Actinoplanes TaxID=2626549 RepID=UPI00340533BE
MLHDDVGLGEFMTVYYRGPAGTVTESHFVTHSPDGSAYDLNDLRNIMRVRRRGPRFAMLLSAAVAVIVAGLAAGWAMGAVSGLPVVLVAVLAAVFLVRLASPVYTLRADHRDRAVELYSTKDRVDFERVCRNLERALEDLRPA